MGLMLSLKVIESKNKLMIEMKHEDSELSNLLATKINELFDKIVGE